MADPTITCPTCNESFADKGAWGDHVLRFFRGTAVQPRMTCSAPAAAPREKWSPLYRNAVENLAAPSPPETPAPACTCGSARCEGTHAIAPGIDTIRHEAYQAGYAQGLRDGAAPRVIPASPASAPSGTTGEALRLAAHYIRYGDGQSQDLAGNVSRGRERETVTTRPSRGEALAAVERALSPVEFPGEEDWSYRCPECGASVCSHVVLMARRAAPAAAESTRADLAPDYEVIEAAYLASNADGAFRAALDAAFHQGLRVAAPREVEEVREALRMAEAALVRARDALNHDRTGLAAALNRIQSELVGRYWMRHEKDGGDAGSWGSYPYTEHTTETLRREVSWAFGAIGTWALKALNASGNLAGTEIRAMEEPIGAVRSALARLSSASGEAPERGDGEGRP